MQSQTRTLQLGSLILITIFMVVMSLLAYQFLNQLIGDVFTSIPVMDDIKEWDVTVAFFEEIE